MRGVTLVFGIFAIAFFSAGAAASDRQLRFVTLEFAPFIYGEDKQVAGPGRDVIAAVCDRAAIGCTFDIFPWRRAQELMRTGDADGMMVIGRNPEREEWLRFSPRMFRTEYGFFVTADNPLEYREPGGIPGYRVGVFAPSNTARTLNGIRETMVQDRIEPVEIDRRPDDAAGFRKLAAGRLDAVFSNRDRGWKVLKDEGISNKVRYAGAHRAIFYYAGITKSFPRQDVADSFFEAWSELNAEGRLQDIIRSYGLEPASQD